MGAKNGKPWTRSQWLWDKSTKSSTSRPSMAFSSARIPVPASSTSVFALPKSIATDDVFPPYRAVHAPGLGIEPRTPQNVPLMDDSIEASYLFGHRQSDKDI